MWGNINDIQLTKWFIDNIKRISQLPEIQQRQINDILSKPNFLDRKKDLVDEILSKFEEELTKQTTDQIENLALNAMIGSVAVGGIAILINFFQKRDSKNRGLTFIDHITFPFIIGSVITLSASSCAYFDINF